MGLTVVITFVGKILYCRQSTLYSVDGQISRNMFSLPVWYLLWELRVDIFEVNGGNNHLSTLISESS